MFLIGVGKSDITAFERGSAMLGYGLHTHIALDVETPLYARAYIIEDMEKQHKLAIVNCEICFITHLLKQTVLESLSKHLAELNIKDENLMLSAQHTHCSPSGYSGHAIYNISTPGFVQHILDTLVKGIIEALVEADRKKVKGKIHLGKSAFGEDVPVSFNRTVNSYNQNPEVKKYTFDQRHLAVDREMTLLHFISEEGNLLGSINWFAVHTTSLPNNFTKLCSDNKGFAADYLEKDFQKKHPNYVGAFAQGACGDVSARVKYNPKLSFQRGKYEGYYSDDLKSSKFNGMLQYEKAKEIIESETESLKGDELDCIIQYVDFSNINIKPEFCNGQEGATTSPSVMGVSFLGGSRMDGPGMHPILLDIGKTVADYVKNKELYNARRKPNTDYSEKILNRYKAQGKKHLAIESGDKRVFGNPSPETLLLPGFSHPMIQQLKYFAKLGLMSEHCWAPQILPIQIFKIGSLAIVALPFEITTVASWRLRNTVEDVLLKQGFETVILCPYSNSFNAYITTYEEYQIQDYEAGHCVFGQWSLNALQQVSANLSSQFLKKPEDREIPVVQESPLSATYLERFAYKKSDYYLNLEKKGKQKKEEKGDL